MPLIRPVLMPGAPCCSSFSVTPNFCGVSVWEVAWCRYTWSGKEGGRRQEPSPARHGVRTAMCSLMHAFLCACSPITRCHTRRRKICPSWRKPPWISMLVKKRVQGTSPPLSTWRQSWRYGPSPEHVHGLALNPPSARMQCVIHHTMHSEMLRSEGALHGSEHVCVCVYPSYLLWRVWRERDFPFLDAL